eukprot:TRINITY_DN3849_c0_g1_i3.p1 TRINITY_DN3849_c0_g1~~TRINITY_DN3849_c0_g1_i3.p1  ORF type:complete len:674 (+),score=195.78 TRINITY_DN3849_c0_g1_i3:382-2403(+)
MDWERFGTDARMGVVSVPLKSIGETETSEWFQLKPQKPGDAVSGSLHLKLRFSEKDRSFTPSKLWKAVKASDIEGVESLLKDDSVDMKEKDENGESLLHMIVSLPNFSEDANNILIKLLKHSGTDVNITDNFGNTALHAFCRSYRPPGCEQPFNEYIQKGANVSAQNIHGETPLHQAVFNPSVKVLLADLLLKMNADPNIVAKNGDTPLHYAISIGRVDLVKLLIAHGASVEIAGHQGFQAIPLAKSKGLTNVEDAIRDSIEVVRWLKRNGFDKYTYTFVDQEIYLYLLPDLKDSELAKHVTDKEDRAKILFLAKDIKLLSRKETFLRKQSLFQKRAKIQKKQEKLRTQLKNAIKQEGEISWEIDTEELEFVQSLGRGAFGEVFKGFYKTGKPVAIKVLKSSNSKREMDEFVREFSVLINIQSPYVVHFYGATLKMKLCMVMELCERGSLYDVLGNNSIDINWERAFDMLEEIVKGIQTLHNHDPPILHRDLKTLNVLVTEDFHCRIADFGLSRFDTASNLGTLSRCRGTYAYIAPEVYEAKKYIKQSDVYSIGIMMWEFVQRCLKGVYSAPYSEYSFIKIEVTILLQAATKKLRPTVPENCPESLMNLIHEAWKQEKEERPDCDQLLEKLQVIRQEYLEKKDSWDSLLAVKKKSEPAEVQVNTIDEDEEDVE